MDIHQIEFWELFVRCAKYKLKVREIQFILWNYGCNISCERIAKLEGKKIGRSAVHLVIRKAIRRIQKRNCHL